jgi:hypothetical protein
MKWRNQRRNGESEMKAKWRHNGERRKWHGEIGEKMGMAASA